MHLSRARNKWLKYQYMRSFWKLKPYIPETEMLSYSTFRYFIKKYKKVVIKPINGSRGRNVYEVIRMPHNQYHVHIEKRDRILDGRRKTYNYLLEKVGSFQNYMIQRRVSRVRVDRRPWDMRVIIQRKRHSLKWKITGILAKITGEGYFVSNITRSNGSLVSVKYAIENSDSLKDISTSMLKAKLARIAILTAKTLSDYFPRHRIYGLDMGLDRYGRFWVIEANLYPSMSHFQKYRDKSMLRRIMRYKNE